MAYQEFPIGTLGVIPGLVSQFARDRGWVASEVVLGPNDAPEVTIQMPGVDEDDEPNGLAYLLTTFSDRLILQEQDMGTFRGVSFRIPYLRGTSIAPVVLHPTKLHLFGNDAPFTVDQQEAPYIAIVVEFGYNYYRHMYLGKLVKIGNYEGGNVLTCNNYQQQNFGSSSPTSVSAYSPNHRRLFAARYTYTDDRGGVLIEHEDNAVPWRRFNGPYSTNARTNMTDGIALGGMGDAINDGLVRRGVAHYAGGAILVPINLYATLIGGDDVRFVPIGYPPGIRAMDVRDTLPGADIVVGNEDFKVFPEFSKKTFTSSQRLGNTGYYFWHDETSHNIGYAYKKEQ